MFSSILDFLKKLQIPVSSGFGAGWKTSNISDTRMVVEEHGNVEEKSLPCSVSSEGGSTCGIFSGGSN